MLSCLLGLFKHGQCLLSVKLTICHVFTHLRLKDDRQYNVQHIGCMKSSLIELNVLCSLHCTYLISEKCFVNLHSRRLCLIICVDERESRYHETTVFIIVGITCVHNHFRVHLSISLIFKYCYVISNLPLLT